MRGQRFCSVVWSFLWRAYLCVSVVVALLVVVGSAVACSVVVVADDNGSVIGSSSALQKPVRDGCSSLPVRAVHAVPVEASKAVDSSDHARSYAAPGVVLCDPHLR